jgi:hypothetical protein
MITDLDKTTSSVDYFEPSKKLIIKLDSQILSSMGNCWQLYFYEHVMNRRPLAKDIPLARGDAMHRMLAHYYQAKLDGKYIGRENVVISESIQIGREASVDLGLDPQIFMDEDLPSFKSYVLKYQYDGWEIQFVESPFSAVIYDSPELMIIWEGVVDLGVRDPKGIEYIVDHKTESRRSNPLLLSNQFEGYSYALKRPIIVNKIGFQTTLPDELKFRRYYFNYSEALISEWKDDAIRLVKEAVQRHKENLFPRNRTACGRYFSGCNYTRVCSAEPEVREHILRAYFRLEAPWDPYTRDPE